MTATAADFHILIPPSRFGVNLGNYFDILFGFGLLRHRSLPAQTTLGTGAHLEGAVLCQTEIVLQTGASLNGWILHSPAGALSELITYQGSWRIEKRFILSISTMRHLSLPLPSPLYQTLGFDKSAFVSCRWVGAFTARIDCAIVVIVIWLLIVNSHLIVSTFKPTHP